MKIYLITGTTKGIGRAIAEAVVSRKDHVLSLSRSADQDRPYWKNVACDLRRTGVIGDKLRRLFEAVAVEDATDVILINNAGVLEPMGPIEEGAAEEIVNHMLVNQAAPAVLMSAFIRMTRNCTGRRRIINISSGAAMHPYSGWAMYCASKAALDMMTLCVAEEQRSRSDGVSVCSVYPGKVETGMQVKIRRTDKSRFPAQPDFKKAKMEGDLLSVEYVARMILELDDAGQFKSGGIYDLRGTRINGSQITVPPVNELKR